MYVSYEIYVSLMCSDAGEEKMQLDESAAAATAWTTIPPPTEYVRNMSLLIF